jgi:hypothetical protein
MARCGRDRSAASFSAHVFAPFDREDSIMKHAFAFLVICGSLLVASTALAAAPTIRGIVGPSDTIRMTTKPGKGGTYRLRVQDRSEDHNFRLTGPGVNVATSVDGTGTRTFTVKLRAGKTYRFVCDPHADEMRGSFRVRR